jgi:hypothetical protein
MTSAGRKARGPDGEQRQLTAQQAIGVAIAQAEGRADIPSGVKPVVELRDNQFLITFPTNNPPGVRGADFHFQVTVDAATGAIRQLLGGQ